MATSTQIDKRYDSDWAKAKSRDLLKDMIARTLLKFRKPKDLKVLCLPGVDAAEILQVYDPLGIPRENITGVEREAPIAEILRGKEIDGKPLGIKVIHDSLDDYLVKTYKSHAPLNFDVVSLDYTGPLRLKHIQSLQILSEIEGRNHFVLHQANLVKRDAISKGFYLMGAGYSGDNLRTFEDHGNTSKLISPIDALISVNRASNALANGGAQEIKSGAYSTMLHGALGGSNSGCVEDLFLFSCGRAREKILDSMMPAFKSMAVSVCEERQIPFKIDYEQPLHSMIDMVGPHPAVMRFFESVTLSNLARDCQNLDLNQKDFPVWLMSSLNSTGRRGKYFKPRDIETYSYVSESGSPMMGDIYFASYPEGVDAAAARVARAVGYPRAGEFRCNDVLELLGAVREFYKQTHKFGEGALLQKLFDKMHDRQFLGSSSRPVLTKQRAIEEFRAGATIEELREKYRASADKPLAQWKAHVTMGTYDENPIRVEEELVEHTEDSDLEKITKEDAIDLLSSGIPVDEIHATYPTSFTLGQLRAYKAHIKMGTYNTDKNEKTALL